MRGVDRSLLPAVSPPSGHALLSPQMELLDVLTFNSCQLEPRVPKPRVFEIVSCMKVGFVVSSLRRFVPCGSVVRTK